MILKKAHKTMKKGLKEQLMLYDHHFESNSSLVKQAVFKILQLNQGLKKKHFDELAIVRK